MTRPTKLYDSGSVAAGAAITSGLLGMGGFNSAEVPSSLQVVIDNTAGTALRTLTLDSYLDDGTTQIDSVVLRMVAFGSAPTGSIYAPGRLRGCIGPNPPGGTSGWHLLYDATSADNGTLDTGGLLTEDSDAVVAQHTASAGTTTMTSYIHQDDSSTNSQVIATAAAVGGWVAFGPGFAAVAGMNLMAAQIPVPRRSRFFTAGAGAGNTVRLRVFGRGRVPGTFSVQMVLPAYAKLTLAAAGAGAARMVVLAG